MQLLVFDPTFGAAGDMILSSLLAAGADKNAVLSAIKMVSNPSIESTERAGIPALHTETHTGTTHRTLDEILSIIQKADASDEAKMLAERVFNRIEQAEETVHQTHHVHFHEIGADDAIADVLGSCTALLSLNPDCVEVLPVSTGYGTVTCAHGIMPVPAPATAEILKNSTLSVTNGDFEGELCTPTGAALLAEFASTLPATKKSGKIIKIGRGAGKRNPADHPNILTVYLKEYEDDERTVDILETNVDDITGEILAETIAVMMENGARDASAIPLIMKKGRGGYLIRVIVKPEDSVRLSKILARETGSLGIRCTPMVHRFVAERIFSDESVVINGKVYTASVKHALLDGQVYSRKAEYDDCKRIADDAGIPLKDVKRIIEEESWKHQ